MGYVGCKYCKYKKFLGPIEFGDYYCLKSTGKALHWYFGEHTDYQLCFIKNEHSDCPDFELKKRWWQFWK
jgi:hypothetical protein